MIIEAFVVRSPYGVYSIESIPMDRQPGWETIRRIEYTLNTLYEAQIMSDQEYAEYGQTEHQIDDAIIKASSVLNAEEIALLRWATGVREVKATRKLPDDQLAF